MFVFVRFFCGGNDKLTIAVSMMDDDNDYFFDDLQVLTMPFRRHATFEDDFSPT